MLQIRFQGRNFKRSEMVYKNVILNGISDTRTPKWEIARAPDVLWQLVKYILESDLRQRKMSTNVSTPRSNLFCYQGNDRIETHHVLINCHANERMWSVWLVFVSANWSEAIIQRLMFPVSGCIMYYQTINYMRLRQHFITHSGLTLATPGPCS